jgi:hypothetical protein
MQSFPVLVFHVTKIIEISWNKKLRESYITSVDPSLFLVLGFKIPRAIAKSQKDQNKKTKGKLCITHKPSRALSA